MEQILLTVPISQYHPLMVSLRVCATTTDSQIAAFGTSQVAVYNDGINAYPITSLPVINLTMQSGFPGSLSWSITDNRYLRLTAVNDAPINWVIGYNIDR
jgi:hypothetical protein